MSRRHIVTTTILICAQLLDPLGAQTPRPALLLAEAIKIEWLTRQGLEASGRKSVEAGRIPASQLKCVQETPLTIVNEIYARALERALTKDEIEDALGFYTSAAGKEYVQYALSQMLGEKGMTVDGPAELSAAAHEQVESFTHRPAGKKMLEDGSYRTPELDREINIAIGSVLLGCQAR